MKENSIIDRIKTVEDAKAATGRPDIDFSIFPEDIGEYMEAVYNITVIIEALNEGWIPNWDNPKEKKWVAWFRPLPDYAFSSIRYAPTIAYTPISS